MRTNIFRIFCLLTTGILILSACNLPAENTVVDDVPPAEDSVDAATATDEPTATYTKAPPTETPTPTGTATKTPIPQPSATYTPEPVTAEVVRESNCRIGPAGNYTLVATYQVGQTLQVIANDLGAGYSFVKNLEQPDEQCYLLTQNIKISGDVSILPSITPPPSPTAAPYFNVSFKKWDKCKGQDFALFTVENVGSVPFRSFYIRVTDSKVDKSVEQALDAFDLMSGCIVAKNIAPLEPGATGYVHSPTFIWNARGNKLNAVIMLCTEKSLTGVCVTQVLEVKP